MEKKIYSRPYATEECFTPNQYVAACAVEPVIPSGMDRNHFYVDGIERNNCNAQTKDNICAGTEHMSRLYTLNELPGSLKGKGLQGYLDAYKNKHIHIDQGYYDLTTSNACNTQNYTNSSYFAPVVLLHYDNSDRFYFLASGPKTSDDPWAYVAPSMKNQS